MSYCNAMKFLHETEKNGCFLVYIYHHHNHHQLLWEHQLLLFQKVVVSVCHLYTLFEAVYLHVICRWISQSLIRTISRYLCSSFYFHVPYYNLCESHVVNTVAHCWLFALQFISVLSWWCDLLCFPDTIF